MSQAENLSENNPQVRQEQQPTFTARDAGNARRNYQHFAFIINRILNRIADGLDDGRAAKFKPSVFQTVHSLHGMFNGQNIVRKPLFRAHMYAARHFDYKGEAIHADRFMARRLSDLRDAERACGLRFFKIRRADGITQKLTSYEGHYLLDVAEWVYLQVRTSPDYFKNPAKAVTNELLDAAIAKLPEFDDGGDDGRERETSEGASLTDDYVIKGQWTKILNNARANLQRATDAGSNPLIEAEKVTQELKKIAREMYAQKCGELTRERLKQARSSFYERDEEEPLQSNGVVSGYNYGGQDDAAEVLEEVVIDSPTPDKLVTPPPSELVNGERFSETPKTENSFSMLEWALYWAAKGVPVFPVHSAVDGLCSCSRGSECTDVGKHPRTPKGLKDATTDAEQIKQWWRKWPEANIGGVTGGRLRILVVDCDPKNGGDASLFDLTEAHGGEWLDTLHVETGSLGSHLFFTYPADVELRNSAGKLAPGIDTRAEGGYVVLPPSLHVSGRCYRIAAAKPMQPAPAWLIEGLTRTPDQKPSNVTSFQERRTRRNSGGAIIPEGERNERLFRVGCAIWGSGNVQDLTDLHARLLEVNAERCSPPMHDSDIAKIAGSIAARYSRGGLIKEGATA